MIPRTSSVSINCVHQFDDDNAHNKTKTERERERKKCEINTGKNVKLNGFVNQSDDNKLIDCNYESERGLVRFIVLRSLDYSITSAGELHCDSHDTTTTTFMWLSIFIGLLCSSRLFLIRTCLT